MTREGMVSSGTTRFCGLLLLFLLFRSSLAQSTLCTQPVPNTIDLPEDTPIGEVVANIVAQDGVTLTVTLENNIPPTTFEMRGKSLVLIKMTDYESATKAYSLSISCSMAADTDVISVLVFVENVNDNDPVFAKPLYNLPVDELTAIGTVIGEVTATDKDLEAGGQLFYNMEPPSEYFGLEGVNFPRITVLKHLDYDVVKTQSFILRVKDTGPSDPSPTRTSTTSVVITIRDVDNRPPWFRPCDETVIGQTTVCLMSGYQGKVNLTEQATGALTLEPGPILAEDGDKGLDAPISYCFLKGSTCGATDGIFSISQTSGAITMQAPVDVPGPILLSVMAYQSSNADKFSTTMVTLEVKKMSVHAPQFEKASYEGFISLDAGVDSLVLEDKGSSKPLRIRATDQDYADGINPDLVYDLDTMDFIITEQGFLLMNKKVPPGMVTINVHVEDPISGQEDVAAVQVEVAPESPSTTEPPSTTPPVTTPTTPITTPTTPITTPTTPSATTTAAPSTAAASSPSPTTRTPDTTPSQTTEGVGGRVGVYAVEEMAAVGATLGVVLLIAVVMLALMAVHIKRQNTDWKKLQEISHFHNHLAGAPGGPKQGVQYLNGGFHSDEHDDTDSTSDSEQPTESAVKRNSLDLGSAKARSVAAASMAATASRSESATPSDNDGNSSMGSHQEEGGVKPILTKERREEDGYKAVWFKQDINPDASEDITIIPQRAAEEDEDEEEEEEEEGEVNTHQYRTGHSDSDSEEDLPTSSL